MTREPLDVFHANLCLSHENLGELSPAVFREIFGYILYNNLSRKQNRAFALAHPYLQKLLLSQEKVNAARVKWCALKRRAAKENSDGQRQSRVPWGCPKNLGFLFHQLETKSENPLNPAAFRA